MEVDDRDKPVGVPDGWTVVQGGKSTPAPKVLPDIGAHAGRPAAGRGTQLDPDQSMRGLDAATTPLAHPTGIDAVDSFTSPIGLAGLAAGGAGVVRAGVAEGAGAAAKMAATTASPLLKFEVTRRAMMAMGAPDWMATGAAAYVSGLGGKGATADAEVAAGPHLDRSAPVRPSTLTQEQIAQRVKSGTGTPPRAAAKPPAGGRLVAQRAEFDARVAARQVPVAEVPPAAPIASPGAASPAATAVQNGLPNQKALNELALAARRAKTVLAPQEMPALVQAVEAGQTPASAVADLMQARLATDPAAAFNARYGLKIPTEAETRFPKGMRGKVSGAQP